MEVFSQLIFFTDIFNLRQVEKQETKTPHASLTLKQRWVQQTS